tara:strand:- start:3879 stop:4742 length:864 start_codon:yes stop_codon:yes gene_type:complete
VRQGISSILNGNFYSLPGIRYSLLRPVLELYSRDLGGAGKPPLIVLHGMLGSSRNWLSAGAELAQHWHVQALDLRNHGRSPHAESMTYEDLVDDVLDWMDLRGLTKADLMGHSMGGKVAMLIACRHPNRVNRLMVIDIAPKSYKSAGSRAEFAAMHEINLAELKSRTEAELKMETRVLDWGMRKFLTTNLERNNSGGWRWAINLDAITTALPELEENHLLESDSSRKPALFVLGGRSRYVAEEDHAKIRAHFPSVSIEVIPESGHNPHMQNREAFTAAVATWAASVA